MESWQVQLVSWIIAVIAVVGIVLAYRAGAFMHEPVSMMSHILFPLAWFVLGLTGIPLGYGVARFTNGGCFLDLPLLIGGPVVGFAGAVLYLLAFPYIP
jgi:hypothetical protein